MRNIRMDDCRDIHLSDMTPDVIVPNDPAKSKLFIKSAHGSPFIPMSCLR